uniref:Putative secreted peptide n=1 Tax=Anopheles braziliensis TaxID=58242 RepID=A0A2M3ZQE7_9DIPT
MQLIHTLPLGLIVLLEASFSAQMLRTLEQQFAQRFHTVEATDVRIGNGSVTQIQYLQLLESETRRQTGVRDAVLDVYASFQAEVAQLGQLPERYEIVRIKPSTVLYAQLLQPYQVLVDVGQKRDHVRGRLVQILAVILPRQSTPSQYE